MSGETIRHPADPRRGGVSVQCSLCLTFLFTEIAFCGFAWYAFRPSLPSLTFPRVSIPLGLLSSLDGRCDPHHTVNINILYYITLCSASYCYMRIFIIKSWFFLPPPSDSGGTAQYLCGSLVNITSEQRCRVFAFAFLKEWEWTYVLSLEPG